jgi:hypothetical protein
MENTMNTDTIIRNISLDENDINIIFECFINAPWTYFEQMDDSLYEIYRIKNILKEYMGDKV